jgi:hypothetical protein
MKFNDRKMNLRLATQPLAGAICLLGVSSQTGASWMLAPAAFLAAYAVLIPGNFVSVLVSRAFWRAIGLGALRTAFLGLAFIGACTLANGGPLLGIAGSLAVIGVLLTAAVAVAALAWRFVPRVAMGAYRGVSSRVGAAGDLTVLLRASLVA